MAAWRNGRQYRQWLSSAQRSSSARVCGNLVWRNVMAAYLARGKRRSGVAATTFIVAV